MNNFDITSIHAQEILDSRGEPTVETRVRLKGGAHGIAAVPSGISTGTFEAHELRDNDERRYMGKGVLTACSIVNTKIQDALIGKDARKQAAVDGLMVHMDGTPHKERLGANSILSVSLACARAVAQERALPLYQSLRETFSLSHVRLGIPVPIMNIINGGKHASTNIALQEFQIIPLMKKKDRFSTRLKASSEIFHALAEELKSDHLDYDVGNEGGFAPDVKNIEQVFSLLERAIARAGYGVGDEISLGLDCAANSFFNARDATYTIAPPKEALDTEALIERYTLWARDYPIISIEDPLEDEAWQEWSAYTRAQGKHILIIGDDLFVTNVNRLKKGIAHGAANAILIKPNQIGTLTETIAAIQYAQKHRYSVVVSHRSGETNDTSIVDIAVATGAPYIKAGAPSRGERVVKYNRLLEIENELFGEQQ